MSNRERVIQLIENVSDQKLIFVVNMLESLKAYANEEVEPDEWDLQMIENAKNENNGDTISLKDFAKELNVDLQNHYWKRS